mmetsp:Transcript_83860/g.259308  ORF Transcript_83860/g.259308 Transcript_83860/m.259308 type:complete len:113 (-) Transcript_83860:63-401(-)
MHAEGDSQTKSHFGLAQVVGALHFHWHCGCSQTLWHGWALGHCSMHMGSEHFVVHGWQLGPEHILEGQTTEQWGWPHCILQPESSVPVQRVWHLGLSHCGVHSSSQVGFVHL